MGFLGSLFEKIKYRNSESYEFCPRCSANLTLQKGYSNELPFWNCLGCGEMLINPEIDTEDNITWICDGCGQMLNIQEGFTNDCGEWRCTECGFTNQINASEVYLSEDEFQATLSNPYKGLSDDAVLELSEYEDVKEINGRSDVVLVRQVSDGSLCVKKILREYDLSVYLYLKDNPVHHMPRLLGVYEGDNNLVIIEEYISGKTLLEVLEKGRLKEECAIGVAKEICKILLELHDTDKSIIHRDIKPSNIIVTDDNEIYLLDINVAKWYKPEEKEDTKLFGTLYYAAPEQFGYGFSASSEKSDVYSLGILLNVMLTGKMPKEEKAKGSIWNVIEKCIDMEPTNRYTTKELLKTLEEYE